MLLRCKNPEKRLTGAGRGTIFLDMYKTSPGALNLKLRGHETECGETNMTKEEYRAELNNMIYLVSCAVKESVPEKSRVESMNLPLLHTVAGYHLLTAAVAYALESAGIHDPAFTQSKAKAMRKIALMDTDMAEIFTRMEEAEIWYMPLKGTILKEYYPQFGMREMADHDILFDAGRADDVRHIMKELGFRVEEFGTAHHDVYFKEPVSNFEMHRLLFGPGLYEKLYEYYRDVEARLLGDGCEKHFSPEDFYIYMTAHEYKHYADMGTGLRSLLDTYVYLQKESLDMAYVKAETEKLGIAEFEAANRALAQRLFSGEALTEEEKETLQYILDSGVHGSRALTVQRRLSDFGYGKLRYAFERFMEPLNKNSWNYRNLSYEFPFFYKHRLFLPLLPFYRVILRLTSGRLKAELKALKKAEKSSDRGGKQP